MEEDALLSDPVENSAEAQAAILAQSQPFDEGQFLSKVRPLPMVSPLQKIKPLQRDRFLREDKALEEGESSKIVMSISEELVFEYFSE